MLEGIQRACSGKSSARLSLFCSQFDIRLSFTKIIQKLHSAEPVSGAHESKIELRMLILSLVCSDLHDSRKAALMKKMITTDCRFHPGCYFCFFRGLHMDVDAMIAFDGTKKRIR